MDEILKEHKAKQRELVANGGLFPDDVPQEIKSDIKEKKIIGREKVLNKTFESSHISK
jgi:hypothetical protein